MYCIQKLKNRTPSTIFKLLNLYKEKFECPICCYRGPFMDVNPPTGLRKHAKCPKCGSFERHRLQYLVIINILKILDSSKMKMLHFAPEPFFSTLFSKYFGIYETADLSMKGVDHNVDLQCLPFEDASYDFVFASNVLEHIPDDKRAIEEIRRVLKLNGIAVLPVPVVCETTIEYVEPNPNEFYHMRAPGMDYFDRYKQYFSRVEAITSTSFPSKYQLFIFEDRNVWPTKNCPLRTPMKGERHTDVVPVCYV